MDIVTRLEIIRRTSIMLVYIKKKNCYCRSMFYKQKLIVVYNLGPKAPVCLTSLTKQSFPSNDKG